MISFKINCPYCKQRVSISVEKGHLGTRHKTLCPNCVSSLLINLPKNIRLPENDNIKKQSKTKIIKGSNEKQKYMLISNSNIYSEVQEFELNQPYLSFGRMGFKSESDLEIITEDKRISRKHCVFRSYPNGVTIEDVSRGGTMLNNIMLKPNNEIYLKNGDILRMGQTFFKFAVIES